VFVDECMRGGYLLIASSVAPGDVVAARRGITDLVRPGQRRLHMVKESPARRRLILRRIGDLGLTATIYRAAPARRTDSARRRACLTRLVADMLDSGGADLRLETGGDADHRDRQHLIELLRGTGGAAGITYAHLHASHESVLAVQAAIGWAWSKGGEWRDRARPLVEAVVSV
jgi:hypothetical protein